MVVLGTGAVGHGQRRSAAQASSRAGSYAIGNGDGEVLPTGRSAVGHGLFQHICPAASLWRLVEIAHSLGYVLSLDEVQVTYVGT